jgi:RHH-type proline utilization regulon transcriptional repressor/proline dehydrogenase/delta 1-pyrroline-5-carboxylate dehydrogenase
MLETLQPDAIVNGSYASLSCSQWFQHIRHLYAPDETSWVRSLAASVPSQQVHQASLQAATLVHELRAQREHLPLFERFMQEYSLSSEEGLTLMVLAEALLRIPDRRTRDALIRAEMSHVNWKQHLGHSDSFWVNMATRGLIAGAAFASWSQDHNDDPSQRSRTIFEQLVGHSGEPFVRAALQRAMQLLGDQFVVGHTIDQALSNAGRMASDKICYSFDMLGEAAMTEDDAESYANSYLMALQRIAASQKTDCHPHSLSIKLSALHPRYEESQHPRLISELGGRLASLVREARQLNVAITLDAEEADRLELSLNIFQLVFEQEAIGWGGFGMAVQAYSKRALPVLGWLNQLALEHDTHIKVRLVKGAYWDTEIKLCQQRGLDGYPIFTRKAHTDISYLACTRFLLCHTPGLTPQFATHNAQTVAAITNMADALKPTPSYEFQRLHGMGEALYAHWHTRRDEPVRVYAPVGEHQQLLPYLVRRLLESGANTSFVHHLWDDEVAPETLTRSPLELARDLDYSANPATPLPSDIYGKNRRNSYGINLNISLQRESLFDDMRRWSSHQWEARPMTATTGNGALLANKPVIAPFTAQYQVGRSQWFNPDDVTAVMNAGAAGFERWRLLAPRYATKERKAWLMLLASALENHSAELITLCVLEAGKTVQDSMDEIREAVDFCRYYAHQIDLHFAQPSKLLGPTGECNELYYEGRGVWLCISPWNFPLAIFIGQITAALAAGNAVVAKPAEATSLIAARAVEIAHQVGIPKDLLQLLPGSGLDIGSAALNDMNLAGVAFTGSHKTARQIALQLAQRNGAIVPFIAETGGQNAMIVDSTALPAQVVRDVLRSAFGSAGQRCSALRVLCLQDDIADDVIKLLSGAMLELSVGDPLTLSTDIGPVIDSRAQHHLQRHIRWLEQHAKCVGKAPKAPEEGTFVTPIAYEITDFEALREEHFGPILHIYRYSAKSLNTLISNINSLGFGLTLSVHSRNPDTASHIERRIRVGNVYVNRDQIGAVVGLQPFGGMGLSGTGPKAGGPNYVLRFATERTRTINTSAVGGNADLLRGNDDLIADEDEIAGE